MAEEYSENQMFSRLLTCLLTFLIIALIAIGCSRINKKLHLSDDNIGEELIESFIEKETGISIDLTPSTLE